MAQGATSRVAQTASGGRKRGDGAPSEVRNGGQISRGRMGGERRLPKTKEQGKKDQSLETKERKKKKKKHTTHNKNRKKKKKNKKKKQKKKNTKQKKKKKKTNTQKNKKKKTNPQKKERRKKETKKIEKNRGGRNLIIGNKTGATLSEKRLRETKGVKLAAGGPERKNGPPLLGILGQSTKKEWGSGWHKLFVCLGSDDILTKNKREKEKAP